MESIGDYTILVFIVGLLLFFIYRIVKYNNLPQEEKDRIHEFTEKQTQEEINKKVPKNEEGKIICPYCKHSEFQMVSRRWSPLAGFFTNKVDRVCTNCKRRF